MAGEDLMQRFDTKEGRVDLRQIADSMINAGTLGQMKPDQILSLLGTGSGGMKESFGQEVPQKEM